VGEDTDTQTPWDLISLLLFFQNKERRLDDNGYNYVSMNTAEQKI
jgi:hypothetical protein